MTYRGHVKNGQIALDSKTPLPEGAEVDVQVVKLPLPHPSPGASKRSRTFKPIEMPGGSLADELVRDRR